MHVKDLSLNSENRLESPEGIFNREVYIIGISSYLSVEFQAYTLPQHLTKYVFVRLAFKRT